MSSGFLDKEKIILGVCAWLAGKFQLNLPGLRIVFLLLLLFGIRMPLFSLSPALVYLLLFLMMPKEIKR